MTEMRNRLHNPRPSGTAAWLLHNEYSDQPASITVTSDALTLTGASNLAHMQELGVTWWCGDGYDRNGVGRPSDALVGYPPCERWTVVA